MLAIKGGLVLTMAGKIYQQGIVLIDGQKIIQVSDNINIPHGAEIIDASGKIVMPGLIDAHSHVGIFEEIYQTEGDDGNEIYDPVTPHLRAIDAINPEDLAFSDALQGGVTAVFTGPGSANVIGGESLVIKTHGQIIDDMVVRRPAGIKVAFGENPKRVYGKQQKLPSTRMSTAALLREALVRAVDYSKKIESAGQDPAKAPDRDLKLEALVRVLQKKEPLRAHAHRADDIMTAIRIADEFNVDIIIEHCTEGHKIAGELAKRNIPAVLGPAFTNRAKVELKEKSFRTPGILAKAGVKIAIMTDHPVVPIQYLSLCAAMSVKEGLSEEEGLKAITINAAEILGLGDRMGSLEAGKDADVIILDGPLFDLKTRVEQVFINGQLVYKRYNS